MTVVETNAAWGSHLDNDTEAKYKEFKELAALADNFKGFLRYLDQRNFQVDRKVSTAQKHYVCHLTISQRVLFRYEYGNVKVLSVA